jgi:hypothetical protein
VVVYVTLFGLIMTVIVMLMLVKEDLLREEKMLDYGNASSNGISFKTFGWALCFYGVVINSDVKLSSYN